MSGEFLLSITMTLSDLVCGDRGNGPLCLFSRCGVSAMGAGSYSQGSLPFIDKESRETINKGTNLYTELLRQLIKEQISILSYCYFACIQNKSKNVL